MSEMLIDIIRQALVSQIQKELNLIGNYLVYSEYDKDSKKIVVYIQPKGYPYNASAQLKRDADKLAEIRYNVMKHFKNVPVEIVIGASNNKEAQI